MKKFLIGALIGLGVLIGVIGFGVQFAASRLLDTGLEQAKLQLPDNIVLDYDDSNVSLLGRKASLKQVNLTLEDENLNVQVGELTVDELEPSDNEDMPLIMNGVNMKDVNITPLDSGETVHVDEVIVRDVGDSMVKQMMSGGNEEFQIPPSLDVDLIGVELTADMLDEQEFDYAAYGYELPITADISVKYNFSESDQDFQLDHIRVAADDVFAFDFSTHLGGIDMEMINALQDETADDPLFALMTFAESLRLYDLNVTYTDDSFMDRMLGQAADEQGQTLDEFKVEMLAELDAMSAGETDPTSQEMTDAVRDFINDPGEITFGINPETPLTAEDFFSVMMSASLGGEVDAEALTERLNITVSSR